MNFSRVPLHTVHLRSPLMSGCVQIGLQDSLPVEGVVLILRDGIAG